MDLGEVNHQRIKTNGIWLHVVEKGSGPLVLLLHGFPEFWYSWRHQIAFLASRGYHVVAPDLRGHGDSDSPLSPNTYTVLHFAGDLIGLLDHFGEQQAFVIGHDVGAVIGWHLSLFRPDRIKGLIAISVPYFPRDPDAKVIEFFRGKFGDGFYISQFQEPGRAERAFARYDYLTVMKKFLLINKSDPLIAPSGMEIIDYLQTPAVLPPWITEEELQVYADKFEESGFTGSLNYYRAMDLNWELSAPWQGAKITVPTKCILGDTDIGFDAYGTRDYVQGDIFKSFVPDLEVVILDGHHFIQQERAHEVSQEILTFLQKLSFDNLCKLVLSYCLSIIQPFFISPCDETSSTVESSSPVNSQTYILGPSLFRGYGQKVVLQRAKTLLRQLVPDEKALKLYRPLVARDPHQEYVLTLKNVQDANIPSGDFTQGGKAFSDHLLVPLAIRTKKKRSLALILVTLVSGETAREDSTMINSRGMSGDLYVDYIPVETAEIDHEVLEDDPGVDVLSRVEITTTAESDSDNYG
ncbi:unnamed protein product [Dovyalis caffra]|uniref:soluble epoxide hydrolase n=1 Tax=Dovyalis caffra TaxID=77055 RepID=A0AAV1REZ8_9ROSI|nr:unnamed protein product [Dovyalis caffra]